MRWCCPRRPRLACGRPAARLRRARDSQIGVASRQTLIESLTANPASARAICSPGSPPSSIPPRRRCRRRSALPARSPRRAAQFLAESRRRAEPDTRPRRCARSATPSTPPCAPISTARRSAPLSRSSSTARSSPPCRRRARPSRRGCTASTLSGVHLRAGRVARGGIRASDRPDDFRAEILGLMRTQVVKNAVIVPVGAKGGFVVKRRGAARSPIRRASKPPTAPSSTRCCRSPTTSSNGAVVRAAAVRSSTTSADPYLVVAADKGTATFSDVANELAAAARLLARRRLRLGRAARLRPQARSASPRAAPGRCARQHFRELGRDLDRETVTRRRHRRHERRRVRQRPAALAPSASASRRSTTATSSSIPIPTRSCRTASAQRLFHLPRSSWTDYAPTSLSRGGGVYPRSAKAIPLSPEARRAARARRPRTPSGEERRARHPAPAGRPAVERRHRHLRQGERRAPRRRRRSGQRRRCASTRASCAPRWSPRAATSASRSGRASSTRSAAGTSTPTRSTTPAASICSDHEVNLKIALQPLRRQRRARPSRRATRCSPRSPTPVCDAVLAHNAQPGASRSASIRRRSRTRIAAFRDLISILEAEAGLDRQLAQLPTREALRARRGVYLGLTRPELAVLLAHTKLDLQRRIVAVAAVRRSRARGVSARLLPRRHRSSGFRPPCSAIRCAARSSRSASPTT